jgi:integrase
MIGNVRCNRCDKRMSRPVCECGSIRCYINIYWKNGQDKKGKHYKFRKYKKDATPLHYDQADRQLTVMRAAIDAKTFNPVDWLDSTITELRFENKLSEWLEEKEKELKAQELAFATIKMYQSYSRNYYTFFDGWDIREIKNAQIRKFKTYLRKFKLAIKTRRNILAILRCFFNWLGENGDIETVPVFPKIKGDDSKVRVALEQEEQYQALDKLPDKHRGAIEFLMETGLRPGEVCALKLKDIFIDKKYAVIQRTYSAKMLKETTKAKNKKPIPLSDRAIEILLPHIKNKFPQSFVFGYTPRVLQNAWRKYSGLNITLYEATRHSFCTQIVETEGVNTLQAQALMRHSDTRSTEKYFKARVEKLRKIVNRRTQVV